MMELAFLVKAQSSEFSSKVRNNCRTDPILEEVRIKIDTSLMVLNFLLCFFGTACLFLTIQCGNDYKLQGFGNCFLWCCGCIKLNSTANNGKTSNQAHVFIIV